MSNDIAIRIENLSKKFVLRHPIKDSEGNYTSELWALKNISLEIKKGQSVGIIGANGSGKSTLLKILAGVTIPTIGKIEINGRVASILDIGAGFHPELTGRENVYLNGQLLGFSKKEIQKKIDEIVAFSGIEKFIDEPVKKYSNGMYLRLAFSIMSHLDFDLYLFDEVMSVGDAEFAFKSKRKLQSLITSERSVLFVSHNVEELSNHDIFILLENGKIKEKSNKSNILLNYVEKSINQYSPDIATSAAYITDFTKYPISDDVKVNFVRFYQGSPVSKDEFKTDCEFIIEINYDKLKNTDTIDVILGIANIQDSLILSSSPFVTEDFSEDKSQATYHCRCILPPNLFHSQVYKINLFFVKNVKQQLVERQRNDISKEGYFFERALKMLNVISFKPVFLKREKPIDLSSINIAGHLLCGFNWDTKIQK